MTSDLQVIPTSDALRDCKLDIIVTGSIAATEAVKFVRSLRRLGADTHVWLSQGGAKFITPMALEWASANPVRTDFDGLQSHLAERDACVVAPASANFARKLAQGITDTSTSALAASYLGAKRPLLVLPTMHQSLSASPAISENIATLSKWAHVLKPRIEEGKEKFPDPSDLADDVAHILNANSKSILVGFGGTKAYIDDVRYIANYSSGALGSLVCEELYRQGFEVKAVQGTATRSPKKFSSMVKAETFEAMQKESQKVCDSGVDGVVFMTSVLDYVPKNILPGKTPSGKKDLDISLEPTEKILPKLKSRSSVKIGFKLESGTDLGKAQTLASKYLRENDLSMLVMNNLSDVSETKHKSWIYESPEQGVVVEGKKSVAAHIVKHINSKLNGM